MKKTYLFIVLISMIFSISVIYDITIYGNAYFQLVNIQETICYLVSKSGGVTKNIKEILSKKEISIEYEKNSDINGAAFEFSLLKKVDYLFVNSEKYVKLDLVVILGY